MTHDNRPTQLPDTNSVNLYNSTILIPSYNVAYFIVDPPARKFKPLSVARALAMRVFEQPGGPYRRIPWGRWGGRRVRREDNVCDSVQKGGECVWGRTGTEVM
jgi:hypothetical protein